MEFKSVSANQIQTRHSDGSSADNRVRKSWVLQMPDEVKNKFKHLPGQVKQQLYKSFDDEVKEIWVKMMNVENQTAIDNNASVKKIDGEKVFVDTNVDTDNLLLIAAQQFIEDFSKRDMK